LNDEIDSSGDIKFGPDIKNLQSIKTEIGQSSVVHSNVFGFRFEQEEYSIGNGAPIACIFFII
jgi:hypothetical protein